MKYASALGDETQLQVERHLLVNQRFSMCACTPQHRRAIVIAMRTVSDDVAVRLYHLDDDGGAATTILYGTLAEALHAAGQEPEEIQAGLFLQTSNDVVAYLDFLEG